MASAGAQHPTNRSWPRKRRRQAVQTDAGRASVAVCATTVAAATASTVARKKPFRQLVGRKYIRLLEKFIGDLRRHNPHPNRDLYMDDVVTILLLGFFNSDIRSLRKLELFSQVPGVKQSLSVDRVCRSTLSEGLKLFDSSLLAPILQKIYQAIPNQQNLDPEFQGLYERLMAFDGSYFRVPAQVLWALHEKSGSQVPGRQVRLNLHYCIGTGNPAGLSVSGEDGDSEAQAILKMLVKDMIYVADRGVFSFAGVQGIVEGGGHFVFRLKFAVGFTCESENILTEKDIEHRVISDRIGYLTGSNRRTAPPIQVREILIYNPDNPQQPIRLLTDMLDLPAHIIGLIYLHRWTIELFFRWLKVYANFEHMISHSPQGVETWFYVAMIGTLLMSLYTQQEPSTYAFTAMWFIISGAADYEDLAPQLARFARERELTRKRRAAKKLV